MAAANSGNAAIILDFKSRRTQARGQLVVVPAAQRGMRFLRRTEIGFNPKMQLHASALKPTSTAIGQFRRLVKFNHAQQITIETASGVLFSDRHRKLHVIEGDKRMC